jgi:hypothetical protein
MQTRTRRCLAGEESGKGKSAPVALGCRECGKDRGAESRMEREQRKA